jgi:hypothetical protein
MFSTAFSVFRYYWSSDNTIFRHKKVFGALLVLTVLCMAAPCRAQSIEVISPDSSTTINEGDDFATNVLQNPWDMSERRDIGFEEYFQGNSISVHDGLWTAVNQLAGGYVFPLFGGFIGSLTAEGLSGDRQLPKFGINHPINSSRYSVLSFRMRHSARSTYAIYWANNPQPTYFPDGSLFGANLDGVYLDRAYPHSGFDIYTFDMRSPLFETGAGAWTGMIHALRLDPSTGGAPGTQTDLDWIRLVNPDSAPKINIRWKSSNIPSGSLITIYADTGSSGFNGTPIAEYVHDDQGRTYNAGQEYTTTPVLRSDTGTHLLPTAILPPGRYRFYLTAETAHGGIRTLIARSGYSAELNINAAPTTDFITPSQISGSDYATDELHNPWDMSDVADVANLPGGAVPADLIQYSHASFTNGMFQATADAPRTDLGNSQGDAQVWLPISAAQPIRTNKYRYLTYTIGADQTLFPTIEDKVAQGWVSRPVFWGNDLFGDGASTKAHILYEGVHTYTIDLWDDSTVERGMPWRSIPLIQHLRIDPLETSVPTWFFLDSIKLTTDNFPVNGNYRLRWNITDSDSRTFSIRLYAASSRDSLSGTLLMSAGGLAGGEHYYDWNTTGFPPGSYYISAVTSDGLNSSRTTAPVPVVIQAAQSGTTARKVPYDFDGDGKSDPLIFRPDAVSNFFIRPSSAPAQIRPLGAGMARPLVSDIDGDGIADLTTVQPFNNSLLWMTSLSSTGSVLPRFWGMPGDSVLSADFDGDGKSEIAVYRNGVWYLLSTDGTVTVRYWGEAGDIPAPADFNGDGKADIAIWRPRDGTWWVINSADQSASVTQWGLPGDIPLPADFDNDGKADFAVWRPGDGSWYLRFSQTDSRQTIQWGLPGDIPLVGDYDGDGRLDLTVYRPSNGYWFINNRFGTLLSSQWGLPQDLIPKNVQN